MTLLKQLKHKGEKLAELLAQSKLPEPIKELILDKIHLLPEDRINYLITSLESELELTNNFRSTLAASLAKIDKRWNEVSQKQSELAKAIVSKKIAELTS